MLFLPVPCLVLLCLSQVVLMALVVAYRRFLFFSLLVVLMFRPQNNSAMSGAGGALRARPRLGGGGGVGGILMVSSVFFVTLGERAFVGGCAGVSLLLGFRGSRLRDLAFDFALASDDARFAYIFGASGAGSIFGAGIARGADAARRGIDVALFIMSVAAFTASG